jgi:hypothetical protein
MDLVEVTKSNGCRKVKMFTFLSFSLGLDTTHEPSSSASVAERTYHRADDRRGISSTQSTKNEEKAENGGVPETWSHGVHKLSVSLTFHKNLKIKIKKHYEPA